MIHRRLHPFKTVLFCLPVFAFLFMNLGFLYVLVFVDLPESNFPQFAGYLMCLFVALLSFRIMVYDPYQSLRKADVLNTESHSGVSKKQIEDLLEKIEQELKSEYGRAYIKYEGTKDEGLTCTVHLSGRADVPFSETSEYISNMLETELWTTFGLDIHQVHFNVTYRELITFTNNE